MKLALPLTLLVLLVACSPAPKPALTRTSVPPSAAPSTPTFTPTPRFPAGETITSALDGMLQQSIPAGEFPMGTLKEDIWIGENEMPQHLVYLDGFWMDETEVTNAQYALCVQAGTCLAPHKPNSYSQLEYYGNAEFDAFPVVQVDWSQAKAYCEWAGRRLPSEAEWEKAARGDSARTYPWAGEGKGPSFANFGVYNIGDTTAVKTYLVGRSPYGIFDMAGNVYEWVADWYSGTYYSESPAANPSGPQTGLARVIRGGAWNSDWVFIRTASRMYYYPQDFSGDIGFRCAQTQ